MTIHFLAGLPCSGADTLVDLLNQNPDVHARSPSGLVEALDGLAGAWSRSPNLSAADPRRTLLAQTMAGAIQSFYGGASKRVVIDGGLGWARPEVIASMGMVLGREPKIVVTVRPLAECMAAMVLSLKPDSLDDALYKKQWLNYLKSQYSTLATGFESSPKSFLFIEHGDLMADPIGQLERAHAFLGLKSFAYKAEPRRVEVSPKMVLGVHYPLFCQHPFWSDKPEEIEVFPLDKQLLAARTGDFEEGWRLAQEIERDEPSNHRAAFNRGWYYLRQGKIREGYGLLHRGGIVGVADAAAPPLKTPEWDGKSRGTALLYLGGGFGDQIHQVRYAKNIVARGCKVITACSPELAGLLSDVEGVSAVVDSGRASAAYHDFWVPGMTAPLHLGFDRSDIDGTPYIRRPEIIRGRVIRIGLRWQGNVLYEKDHFKKFPPELMFAAMDGVDAEFISLQRDEGAEHCPSWVKQVPLETWEQTQLAVASCDLVISACTSVSHLAGAMGIPTWVVLPVLPYYLYAEPGPLTPYYDSFTLYRQEVFGEWEAPFNHIAAELQHLRIAK